MVNLAIGAMCANCKVRPATGIWIGEGGTMAYIHGGGAPWCRLCMGKAQLAHCEEAMTRADTLRREISELELLDPAAKET